MSEEKTISTTLGYFQNKRFNILFLTINSNTLKVTHSTPKNTGLSYKQTVDKNHLEITVNSTCVGLISTTSPYESKGYVIENGKPKDCYTVIAHENVTYKDQEELKDNKNEYNNIRDINDYTEIKKPPTSNVSYYLKQNNQLTHQIILLDSKLLINVSQDIKDASIYNNCMLAPLTETACNKIKAQWELKNEDQKEEKHKECKVEEITAQSLVWLKFIGLRHDCFKIKNLTKNIDAKSDFSSGMSTLLHLAMNVLKPSERLSIIDFLIKINADITVENIDGISPLFLAIKRNNINILKIMLEQVTNKKTLANILKTKYGAWKCTPLQYAMVVCKNQEIVDLLLEKGALINEINSPYTHVKRKTQLYFNNYQDTSYGPYTNILFYAVSYLNVDLVKRLLQYGADFSIKSKNKKVDLINSIFLYNFYKREEDKVATVMDTLKDDIQDTKKQLKAEISSDQNCNHHWCTRIHLETRLKNLLSIQKAINEYQVHLQSVEEVLGQEDFGRKRAAKYYLAMLCTIVATVITAGIVSPTFDAFLKESLTWIFQVEHVAAHFVGGVGILALLTYGLYRFSREIIKIYQADGYKNIYKNDKRRQIRVDSSKILFGKTGASLILSLGLHYGLEILAGLSIAAQIPLVCALMFVVFGALSIVQKALQIKYDSKHHKLQRGRNNTETPFLSLDQLLSTESETSNISIEQ